MTKIFRHGDVGFVKVKELPKGLTASKSNSILEGGSGGNTHSFKGGAFYPKKEGEHIIGYFKAKDSRLFHAEHSPKGEAELPNGIYEVRRQVEFTHEGMRQVID